MFTTKPTNILVIGDFNLDFNSTQAVAYSEYFSRYSLKNILGTVTSVKGTQIDLVLGNCSFKVSGIFDNYYSDHKAVYAVLNTECVHSNFVLENSQEEKNKDTSICLPVSKKRKNSNTTVEIPSKIQKTITNKIVQCGSNWKNKTNVNNSCISETKNIKQNFHSIENKAIQSVKILNPNKRRIASHEIDSSSVQTKKN
jgi:hypothetical protein